MEETITTVLVVIFILICAPIIAAGLSRCPKCHGYCTDKEDCEERQRNS